MKNLKALISGILLIGSIVNFSVQAFADTVANAFISSRYKITIDGEPLQIPGDMAILNYNDRIYVPARLIAEGMGGKVYFNEESRIVDIRKPEPETKEIIKEVEVIKEVYVMPESKYQFTPVSKSVEKVKMDINELYLDSSQTKAYAKVRNDNIGYVVFRFRDFYMEADGERYDSIENYSWGNSINGGGGTFESAIVFDKLPKDAENVTITLPFAINNPITGESGDSYELKFHIKLK